jgi:hypothetical protein
MASALPNQIPPQATPWSYQGADGQQVIEELWYLFLYGLWAQVSTQAAGGTVLSPAASIAMLESEIYTADVNGSNAHAFGDFIHLGEADASPAPTDLSNTLALLSESEIQPVPRDISNAMMLALDGSPPDAQPRAQPAVAITVGASPFTFTAPANGTVAISGGNVSMLTLIRQGVSVPTGLIAALIPVSRLDQVQITYLVAPTANFLPT